MDLEDKKFREVILWARIYADFKKTFEEYLSSCLLSMEHFKPQLFSLLKKRNGSRIEINYCDRMFILDFSIIKKAKDSCVACGKIFEIEQGLEIQKGQEKLIPVGGSIYVDQDYIYELKDGTFVIAKDTIVGGAWLDNFIISVLHRSFE